MALKYRTMYCVQLAFVIVNLMHTQAENIICPDIIKVELGSDVIISCDMNNLQDVYWFRGSTLRTSPILRLEGDNKGGTEYGNGQFDIYANGSIRINAVRLEHEGSYNVVAYFTNGSSGESSVNVTITVTPTFPCPVINTCKDCADCNVTVNSSGFIECSINGTRPKMFLSWEIDTQVGFSLFEFKPIVHHETSLDTWSSRIRLKHDGKSCDGKLIIRCVADDPAGLLIYPFSSVNIFTVPCSEDLSIERHFPKALLICVVLLVVVLMMSGIGCFAYIFREKRHKRASTSQEDSQEKVPLSTQENTVIEKTTEYLMQGLKEVNQQFCFVLPAPGCEAVSVTAVYTDIQCLVTSKTESEEVSSDVFLQRDFITQERFVVFQGKLGYGKTVLVLRMLHEVLSNRNYENDSIIIYVPVQNYEHSTTLFDIVKEQLPKENIISEEDFEETLEVSKFLVILDGFYGDFANALGNHDLTIGTVEPSTTSTRMESSNYKNTCTIAKLLDPAFIDKYKNIKLWVTTRETLPCTMTDHLPFKIVEVKGFSDKDRELFISKLFSYFTRSFTVDKDRETGGKSPTFDDKEQKGATLTRSSKGAETTQGAGGEQTSKASIIQDQDQHGKNCRKICVLVDMAMKDFAFISEFCKTPLYLGILVHRTSAKFWKNDADSKEILFKKLPVWMQEVVSILEWRYLQKTSKEDEVTKQKILKLGCELSKVAVNMKFSEQTVLTLSEWTNWLDPDMIKIALSIGYLRLRNQLDKTLCTVIDFQDSYFTDYFAGLYFDSASKAVEHLEDMINKDTEEETNQLLIFICGYQQSLKEAIIKSVLKHNKIDILVDIIYLGINPEEGDIKKILRSNPFIMKISSHDIEKRKDGLKKFGRFCMKNNVIAGKISFHCGGGGNLSLLESLTLPPSQQLEFVEQNFEQEKYFSDCLKWLYAQNVREKCRFNKCSLPETFSEEVQSYIKHLTNQGISVERETDDVIEVIEKAKFWKVVKRKIRQLGNVFQTGGFTHERLIKDSEYVS